MPQLTIKAGAMPSNDAVSQPPAGLIRAVDDVKDRPHAGQERLFALRSLLRSRDGQIQQRIHQHLQGDAPLTVVSGEMSRTGGENSSGWLPTDRALADVPRSLRVSRPHGYVIRLFDRSRKPRLRCGSVIDIQHGHIGIGSQVSAQRVVLIGMTHDKAAAVEARVDALLRSTG